MILSGPIVTQWGDDGVHMKVLQEVSFVDSTGHRWVVPAGFTTDGCSIPQEFWSLIGSPFTGLYRNAAIFHDAAYANAGVAKADADKMLRDAMLGMGCPEWLANIIYAGVSVGGKSSYISDQKTRQFQVVQAEAIKVTQASHM